MKISRTTRITIVLLAAAFAAAPAHLRAQQTSNAHMLWSISSDAGVEGFMVGTVHLMKPDVYPLDKAYQDAFAASDILVFEINLDSAVAKGEQFLAAGMLQDGKTLESVLSPDVYQLTLETVEELGLPPSFVEGREPWLLAVLLPVVQYTRAGYAGTSGIDMHFFAKAKEAGKKRLGLETVEFQIQMFDGIPADLQEAYLRMSLERADRTVANLDEIVEYWKTGDATALAAFALGEIRRIPEFYQGAIVERNNNWLPQIEEMLTDEAVPMIVVGAGHIIGGDGLVRLLRARGYSIEQM